MSYCRTSTNNFKSDVYVYATAGGWAIHVAYNRIIRGRRIKLFPDSQLLISRTRKLKHKWAGKSWILPTRQATIDKLLLIRKSGLRVPQTAIWRLQREIREQLKRVSKK